MAYLLYLLVILIILYLFLRNIDSFIVNDDKWIDYRLGDILSGYCLKKEPHYIKYVKSKHNGTIGKRYLNAIKYKTQSLNQVIITKIIKEHIKNNNIKIDNNLIILNLRVGDVITNDNFNNQQVFARNKRIYYYKKDNYNLICQYLKKKYPSKKKIKLIYGSHKKKNIENSIKYINEIKTILKKHGYTVLDNQSRNPDNDFCFMTQSSIYIRNGGAFSNIISDLVTHNNNIVIDPKNFNRDNKKK
jgi:hypothetical protein